MSDIEVPPLVLGTGDKEGVTVEDLDDRLRELAKGIQYALSTMAQRMLLETNSVVKYILDPVDRNINTLFTVLQDVQNNITEETRYVDDSITRAETNLSVEHSNIVSAINAIPDQIEAHQFENLENLNTAMSMLSADISATNNDNKDFLDKKVDDSTLIVTDRLDDVSDGLNRSMQFNTKNIVRSIVDSEDTINNNITLGNTQLNDRINMLNDNLENSITTIQSDLITLSATGFEQTLFLWDDIKGFILEHFEHNIDNLTKMYMNQYKAETIAKRRVFEELGGE